MTNSALVLPVSTQNAQALINTFTTVINGISIACCDARELHTFLQVGRDFTNWIKGRLTKYGFIENHDFIVISRSPELASGNRGAATDYHLTLDTAKELSMVENNEQGRIARRYFITREKQALALLQKQAQPRLENSFMAIEAALAFASKGSQRRLEAIEQQLCKRYAVMCYEQIPQEDYQEACAYVRVLEGEYIARNQRKPVAIANPAQSITITRDDATNHKFKWSASQTTIDSHVITDGYFPQANPLVRLFNQLKDAKRLQSPITINDIAGAELIYTALLQLNQAYERKFDSIKYIIDSGKVSISV